MIRSLIWKLVRRNAGLRKFELTRDEEGTDGYSGIHIKIEEPDSGQVVLARAKVAQSMIWSGEGMISWKFRHHSYPIRAEDALGDHARGRPAMGQIYPVGFFCRIPSYIEYIMGHLA